MRLIKLLLVLCVLPVHLGATTYLADHFDMGVDTNVPSGNASQITSETTGGWTLAGPTEGAAIDILSAAAHSGARGLRFSWVNGDGTTVAGTLSGMVGGVTSFWTSYPDSLWVGYWFRSSIATGGPDGNDHLKILRLYGGGSSIIPDIYYNSGEYVITMGGYPYRTGYYQDDTDWHYFIWQFTGASSGSGTDGAIRLSVDGTEVYAKTDCTFSGTRTDIGWNDINENLSGGWSGGAFTTDWDDFIIATTEAEVESFLGIDATPAPAPPTLSNVTISNGSFR
jgi:hypothetical protein